MGTATVEARSLGERRLTQTKPQKPLVFRVFRTLHLVPGLSFGRRFGAGRLRCPQVPGARFTIIRLPEGGGPYTLPFESPGENYRAAPNSLTVRAAPDGVLRVEKVSWWRDQPPARRFLEWLPRVHQGEFGGVLIRLVWCLTGFMPAVLYVSGFLMWRRRLNATR